MKRSTINKDVIAQQAAEWTEILKSGSQRDRAAFDEWLMESPRHVREFLMMTAIDKALDSVDPEHKQDVRTLLAQSGDDVIVLPQPSTGSFQPGRGTKPWRQAAAIAATALICAGAWYFMQATKHQIYDTEVGEQRTIQLTDGSIVYLNTRSRLQVRFSNHERELQLITGQALFKVQKDAARPFRVRAGEAVIQALGTQFDVYRRSDSTTAVSVLEGRVRVSTMQGARDLAAGEAVRLTADGTSVQQTKADLAGTAAWRQRRLTFRRNTLSDVIAEFNRYNRAPQFRLEGDEALAHRHYSGEFDADDPGSLLQLLATDPALAVDRTGDEIVVRAR